MPNFLRSGSAFRLAPLRKDDTQSLRAILGWHSGRSMLGRKTNICLNMIVKNEVKVLPRLIRSVKDYIDYYVIVDTGSSDDTIELIRREMAGYGIEGEVHERPWVNFGVNRAAGAGARGRGEQGRFGWFIDADEELGVSDPKFYEKLEAGSATKSRSTKAKCATPCATW